MATAQQTEVVRFVSKGRNYRAILLNPTRHSHPITGEDVWDQRGFTAEFARTPFLPEQHESDGSFQWPPRPDDPETEFLTDEGLYRDPFSKIEIDVIERLRNHPDCGVRFTELGPDPAVLLEEQRQILGEIARCTVAGNIERLAEIYDEEDNGHKREAVLTASMEGLRAVENALITEREPG